jgi:hypothetical protein
MQGVNKARASMRACVRACVRLCVCENVCLREEGCISRCIRGHLDQMPGPSIVYIYRQKSVWFVPLG